jgi:hypothetical protein
VSEVNGQTRWSVYLSDCQRDAISCVLALDPILRNAGKVAVNASFAWLYGNKQIGFCPIPLDFCQNRTDTSGNTPVPLRPHCGTAYLGQVFLCLLPTFVGHCGGRRE